VIYVHGTSLWHGVRTFGDRITTLCGRRLPSDATIADRARAEFVCRSCATIISLSGLAA
jgi:hypothetical protein